MKLEFKCTKCKTLHDIALFNWENLFNTSQSLNTYCNVCDKCTYQVINRQAGLYKKLKEAINL